MTDRPSPARYWTLDPGVTYLNHGSFGACPRPVLERQQAFRDRLEREPIRFLVRDLGGLWDRARSDLAAFAGCDADDLVFVPNATTGVNTVLRSLRFEPGDELIVTDQEYNACRNALDFVAERSGASVVVARVPFPLDGPGAVLEAVLDKVTERTRLCLIDHVTSQTAVVNPVGRLVEALSARGVDTLVDGAHAPGMVPLALRELGTAYYTGNCHKWLCAPKGAALLYVRKDRQERIRPLVVSHGANSPRKDRSRFLLEFEWTGTDDPTAWLCVPEALRFMETLDPEGWLGVMARNHALAVRARRILCQRLGVTEPCPESMLGSMAAVPLPDGGSPAEPPLFIDPLQDVLLEEYGIEVPVIPWPARPRRLIRVSAQLYNRVDQYERLSEALAEVLSR